MTTPGPFPAATLAVPLRLTEEFYRTVVEHANDAIAVLQNGRLVYHNAAHKQLLEYREVDSQPWSFLEAVVPEDRQRVQEYHQKRLRGEEVPEQYEIALQTREGRRITVEVRPCVVIFQEQPAALVILRDVTARKRAEQALQEANWETRSVLEAIPSILIGLNPAGHITWWNAIAEATLGLSLAAVRHRLWSACMIPWDSARIADGLAQSRATGEVVRLDDVPFHHATGEAGLLGLTINPMKGASGDHAGFLLLGADITARKEADREREEMMQLLMDTNDSLEELTARVQQSYQETEQLLASLSSILIGVDVQGRIVRWNATAERLFGRAAAAVLGQPFDACGIHWEHDTILACMAECRQTGQATPLVDIRYTGGDGKEGFLGITISLMHRERGGPAGFLLIGMDITQRKILEVQLTQGQKLESIGQLAAGIAHEINTPIQYVGDNTRFLQDAFTDLDELLEHYVGLLQAVQAGRVTAELIHDIETIAATVDLAYLREEIPRAIQQSLEGIERVATIVQAMKEFSHPGSAEKTAIDLNKAIESTIAVARNEWKYVAEMVTDFDTTLPLVPCLPGELNQVVLNIIINATHAIADVVGDGSRGKETITVSTRQDGGWIEIRIADTGTGIPAAVQNRIFDPFFTTKAVGKGTGQGLAMAYDVVVQKHGGVLTFETAEGRGTTFIIRLPLESPMPAKKEAR